MSCQITLPYKLSFRIYVTASLQKVNIKYGIEQVSLMSNVIGLKKNIIKIALLPLILATKNAYDIHLQ